MKNIYFAAGLFVLIAALLAVSSNEDKLYLYEGIAKNEGLGK
jgi:hypothetical protein